MKISEFHISAPNEYKTSFGVIITVKVSDCETRTISRQFPADTSIGEKLQGISKLLLEEVRNKAKGG